MHVKNDTNTIEGRRVVVQINGAEYELVERKDGLYITRIDTANSAITLMPIAANSIKLIT